MKKFFLKICIILILNINPLKIAYGDVFIVAKVNQDIITNIDVDFEKKYLVSLNPNLKKLKFKKDLKLSPIKHYFPK